ncbi:hypothetical protein PRIPAC_78679 [Pristionchus pacificus]|uniref:Uncharacterized protein n=1 Tax=Pristionchus pacificus TaxID=54126 RepID=A0A2A6CB21_PRIPA|nr:hypothetical protein PRIPAC_78679 [Pristionchus pacificus]|eukprot:PDM75221.1 hypothetical protein PRIPAC_43415 [Pristionchus pacificus]
MVSYVNREEKLMNIQQVKKEEVINSEGENPMDNDEIIPSQHKTKELSMKKENKKVKTEESEEISDGRKTTTSSKSTPPINKPKEEMLSDDLRFCDKFLVDKVATKKRYRIKVESEDESDPMNEKEAKKSQHKIINPNKKKVPLKKPIIGLLDRWIRLPKDDKKEKGEGQ